MERKVKVENTWGIHKGRVVTVALSEAQFLESTGQGRIIWEEAKLPVAETPEAPAAPPEDEPEPEDKPKPKRRARRKKAE